jgi:hypothetical protein
MAGSETLYAARNVFLDMELTGVDGTTIKAERSIKIFRRPTARLDPQLLTQQLHHGLRVGLAARGFHHLAH